MNKGTNTALSAFEIIDLQDKNERLNAQAAMHEEALNLLARIGNGDTFGNSDGNSIAINALSTSPSTWLTEHDKVVRNQALEDAAYHAESCWLSSAPVYAAEIRAMKGTK